VAGAGGGAERAAGGIGRPVGDVSLEVGQALFHRGCRWGFIGEGRAGKGREAGNQDEADDGGPGNARELHGVSSPHVVMEMGCGHERDATGARFPARIAFE
jgi:hypothetical protein